MKTLIKSHKGPRNLKAILSVFFCGFLALFLVAPASAQRTGMLPEVTIIGTTPAKVNERVLRSFDRTFSEAENPRWFQIGKRFMVKYDMNDMLHKALYRSKGGFIYDIGYGFEKDLPESIRSQVTDSYENFAINTAVNVRQNNRNVWIVNLEDDKNIVFVHVEDGALTEGERLTKSSESFTAYNYNETLDRLVAAAFE